MQKKKIVFFLIIITVIIGVFSSTCYAINPILGHVYSRGVGSACYYVSSSASGYTSTINAAAYNWMYTGCGANPIYLTAVSSSYATHMDFYVKGPTAFGGNYEDILAATTYYTSSSNQLDPTSSNWFFAEIWFNSTEGTFPDLSSTVKQGVTAHEMGHAFGLDEYNSNQYSIMCQDGAGRQVQVVQQCDNDTINYLY